MNSAMLRSLVTIEPGSTNPGPSSLMKVPSAPPKAVSRVYPGAPENGMFIELDTIKKAATHTGGSASVTPQTERDLEMSYPGTPVEGDAVEEVQTVWEPYMNRYRVLACCMMIFANGMNDSAAGALIPYMETHYNIGYGIVSLIFVGNAFGFIVAALFLDAIRTRLGSGRTYALSQVIIAGGYIMIIATAPFPAIVVAFFLLGFGMSISIANANTFVGTLANSTTLLGIVHGSYGVGGTIGPLIATALVTQARVVWSRYYLITLGFTAVNFFLAAWAFWHHDKETCPPQLLSQGSPPSPRSQIDGMLSAFASRVVFLGALFIFAYQGAEVSISGWVISFLITFRGGDPASVGYVTAGFWAGITLGRFVLSAPAHRIGEKRFVYGVTAGCAVFQLLVWWVPNVIGDAVAVSVVGLLLGPVYPCATAIFIRSLSRHEKMSGLGVIAAFGSSGGAAAPFTTGMLAQAVGTWVLHPVVIVLFGVMLVCWYVLPTPEKKSE